MAFIAAKELGVEDFDDVNLKMCCPFHEEDHASFIWNKKNLKFHCFGACGRSYDIIDIFMSLGMTYIEAVQKLFEYAGVKYAFGEYKVQTKYQYRYPYHEECDNKETVYKYLEERHISRETADYLDIGQDKHGNCVFNYYDLNDTLTMVKYRPSRKINKEKGEPKNWCQKDADTYPLLFNMNRINTEEPLAIFCGELDCAAGIEAGWQNSVSIPLGDGNIQWIEKNYDWLDMFNEIIVCHDNDEAGEKFCRTVIPMLGSWRCKIANIPEYYETADGRKYHIKDANEYLFLAGKEKLLDAIIRAKDTPVPSVKDLSDIKPLDFRDMIGVKTGIQVIDKELIKLPFGTLTVLTGMPGAGKSSIISQIVCNTMEQGYNTWTFSGELSNPITKSWFDFVLAGRRHIEEFQYSGDEVYYKIRDYAQEEINEHYRGKWFIYRDDWDNDFDKLIESMTDVIRKYGVKLLVLDNLMVIDNVAGDDELREQTNTVKTLIALAQKYDCAIILVCHPRKLAATATVGMYDIAGTSNIANLAHRTIGLRRVTEDEKTGEDKFSTLKESLRKYDVVVNIIKDRMRGRSNISRGLYYDNVSRRFFSTEEEFSKQYSWDVAEYTDRIAYPERCYQAEVFGTIGGGLV